MEEEPRETPRTPKEGSPPLFMDKTGRWLSLTVDDCRSWTGSADATILYYMPRTGLWAIQDREHPDLNRFVTEPEAAQWFIRNAVEPPPELIDKYFPTESSSTTGSTTAADIPAKHLTVDPATLGYASLDQEARQPSDARPVDPSQSTEARHSSDFRSVFWFGTPYTFTPTQAACVKVLWAAWEQGTPEVGEQTILAEVEAHSSHLKDILRNSPAWKTMIVRGSTKGTFRLAGPT